MHQFHKFIFRIKLYMFRTVPLSIVRSFSLHTHQWYVSYSLGAGSGWNWSCSQAVSKPVWHTPLLCVQWKTPDDGQRNCPKHVQSYSKNKFEKLVYLVGFIIRIYHDAWSPECQKSTLISSSFAIKKNMPLYSVINHYIHASYCLKSRIKNSDNILLW